ncbi:hypothetical protein [Paraburkholderia sp. J8-2]|uniref:hypothetical protein n=1 Tax=Paraburkholderia sp. J8-2 TaxID=2805440 RepID=UPI002AB6C806|nr:hypothetical protein [Paraburkholderia sp. J8-2]
MKKIFLLLGLAGVTAGATAAPDSGCDGACARNVIAVVDTHTKYEMHIDSVGKTSTIYVTWTSQDNPALAPIKYVGTVPLALRHTVLTNYSVPDPSHTSDVCHGDITIAERHGEKIDAYSVPVRNVLCAK